ncbi:MAG: sigma-70 family RNA polymerase sigma factor [Nitrospiraceae bacterium]
MPTVLDDNLIARVTQGDDAAFEVLYDLAAPVLFPLAMRMLGSREEAADTLQDVLLEIWRKASRYDVTRGTPMAWLVGLTRQRALERLRTRRDRNTSTHTSSSTLAPVVELSGGPSADPTDAALRQTMSAAMATLTAEERQLIEWGYFDGVPVSDMATRLRQSSDTTQATLRQGMERLLRSLRASGEAPPRYGT